MQAGALQEARRLSRHSAGASHWKCGHTRTLGTRRRYEGLQRSLADPDGIRPTAETEAASIVCGSDWQLLSSWKAGCKGTYLV